MTWKVQEMTVLFSVKRDLDPLKKAPLPERWEKYFDYSIVFTYFVIHTVI